MAVLRVYVTSGADVRWALPDARGSVASGDALMAPPEADECELVLAAGLSRFALPSLPPGVRRRGEAALGFALEDSLLNEPENNRYSLAVDRELSQVCVQARDTLAAGLEWLAAHGLSARRVVPEEALLPAPADGEWVLARLGGGWALRMSVGAWLTVPATGDALWPGLLARQPPACLRLCGEADLPAALGGLPVVRGGAVDWRTTAIAAPHEFADKRLPWRRIGRFAAIGARRAALALLLLLSADLLLQAGMLGWLRWQQSRHGEALLAGAVRMGLRPHSVDSALDQARLRLAEARRQRGLATDGDWLSLLALAAQLPIEAGSVESMRFRRNVLSLSGEALPTGPAPDLGRRWMAGGWAVSSAPGRLTLRFAPGAGR